MRESSLLFAGLLSGVVLWVIFAQWRGVSIKILPDRGPYPSVQGEAHPSGEKGGVQ